MKLAKTDKELLIKWGYKSDDIEQIEKAIGKTVYELDNQKITIKRAIEVLGKEEFLSGISRSAFHWNASREGKGGEKVYFDSSKLFK